MMCALAWLIVAMTSPAAAQTVAAPTAPHQTDVPENPSPTPAEPTVDPRAPQPVLPGPSSVYVPDPGMAPPAPVDTVLVEPNLGSSLAVHGFVSQGFMLTTGNDYLVPNSTQGSFQMTEVGLNATKEIVSKLRVGVQAFAQNFALGGDFSFKADWFYLDYRPRDWFGLRVGRLKIPFGIFNEVNDIDSARAPILLPQSVYPVQGRNFLFAQTGIELYGFARSRHAGALEYRLYGGTIFIDPVIFNPPGSAFQLQLNVPYVAGGRLFWETPLEGLRLGSSVLAVQLDLTVFGGGISGTVRNRSLLALGTAEYARGGMVFTAEYSRWFADQVSTFEGSTFTLTSERAYAMVSYRSTPWFQPALYYALLFPDVDRRQDGPLWRQDDVAATLRFDVTPHWIIKAEAHYMNGAASLIPPLTVSPPPVNPEQHWGVFLLKTTGYF